jgi:hypothetical protein
MEMEQQWDATEARLLDELKRERGLLADSRKREDQLMSAIITMRERGFGGGHMEQFETPETHAMTDEAELAEHQRRVAAVEGTDEELAAMVRSGLTDEIPEFEEPEEM